MRRRIVVLSVVAALLATGMFGLPLAVGVARYFFTDERGELERLAATTAVSIADELVDHAPVPRLPDTEDEADLGLYTPAGQLARGRGPRSADAAVRTALRDPSAGPAGTGLVVAVPIGDGDTVHGVVRVSTSRSEIDRHTLLTWAAMLGLAVFAVGATWLIARRMAARLASPLESLAGAATSIGDGDFTVRTARAGIPEIDAVAAALETTAHRVGTALERERAFSADASHQLRTPLTGLRLQLEAAQQNPGTDPRVAIGSALVTADRLERTITELLALARDVRPATDRLDITALFRELRRTWEPRLTALGRTLRLIAQDAPTPRAAETAVRHVLDVLLDNATTHGQGTVTVTLREADPDAVAIDVADEGAGIPDATGLFDRREDSATAHGIGLALARSLAEAEGGRLLLSRHVPARFTLLLAAADDAPPHTGTPSDAQGDS